MGKTQKENLKTVIRQIIFVPSLVNDIFLGKAGPFEMVMTEFYNRKIRKATYKTGQTVYILTLPVEYGEYVVGKGVEDVPLFVGRHGTLFVIPLGIKIEKLKRVKELLAKVDKVLYRLRASRD